MTLARVRIIGIMRNVDLLLTMNDRKLLRY